MSVPTPSSPSGSGSPSGPTLAPGMVDPKGRPGTSERTLLGHPPGLFLLFAVEMWERFSYYGMRGLLVLYLIGAFAVTELKPGIYSNDVEITRIETEETRDASGKLTGSKAVDAATRLQRIPFVIGAENAGKAPTGAITNPAGGATLGVKIERLRLVLDPKEREALDPEAKGNPSKDVWAVVPDGIDVPFAVTSAPAAKPFDNGVFAFRITNPGDKSVKLRIGVLRSTEEPRPFLTTNGSPGQVTAEIKPDSKLQKDEKPYQAVFRVNTVSSGRYWSRGDAATLYGWYTGLAYLFPILGGILADKLIGTHRSMVVGGLLISLGHIILGVSGVGELAHNAQGMSLFVMGLCVIVLGTGHFKPCVSVMVGQLYPEGDARRDGAFTIFYMGINLGAFICAFVCGTLGEKLGWHYGFASAAVGMLLGLLMYAGLRPAFLKGVGEAPARSAGFASTLLLVGSVVVSGVFAYAYHLGTLAQLERMVEQLQSNPTASSAVIALLLVGILGWTGWFLSINRREDRGAIVSIFVFMFFNAFFWIAFEQAGSSLNVFTDQNTDRFIGGFEVPATWFQSVNAGLIFLLAPICAAIWTALGKRNLNPSQPVKIALGLIFLGVGFLFMVVAGKIAVGGATKAGMWLIIMTYFWHTVGELCLSPTGLSYVTKAAPAKFVSLLMGIWFVSSFIANLGGGLIAAQVEDIEAGKIKLPWSFGGSADFFFLFVVTSIGAGIVILVLTPLLKMLIRNVKE